MHPFQILIVSYTVTGVMASIMLSMLVGDGVLVDMYNTFDPPLTRRDIVSQLDIEVLDESSFSGHLSPFVFDPECISAVNTNLFSYVGCSLPSRCGEAHVFVQRRTIFEYETVICYNFHPFVLHTELTFARVRFHPANVTPSYGVYTNKGYDQPYIFGYDVLPVNYFNHFYLVTKFVSGVEVYAFVPVICREQSVVVEDSIVRFPETVNMTISDDFLCVTRLRTPVTMCDPLFRETIVDAILDHDFPLTFRGVETNNLYVKSHIYQNSDLAIPYGQVVRRTQSAMVSKWSFIPNHATVSVPSAVSDKYQFEQDYGCDTSMPYGWKHCDTHYVVFVNESGPCFYQGNSTNETCSVGYLRHYLQAEGISEYSTRSCHYIPTKYKGILATILDPVLSLLVSCLTEILSFTEDVVDRLVDVLLKFLSEFLLSLGRVVYPYLNVIFPVQFEMCVFVLAFMFVTIYLQSRDLVLTAFLIVPFAWFLRVFVSYSQVIIE